MAKTAGRGNPPWTRDETILALDLFFEGGMQVLSIKDTRVLELSALRRSLPGNEVHSKEPSFRNAAGVVLKLSNLKSVAVGGGLGNGSNIDFEVWRRFESRPARTKEVAELILQHVTEAPLSSYDEGEPQFAEGMVFTTMHKRTERNRGVRRALMASRRRTGGLRCDACSITNPTATNSFDDAIFEAHHLIPLSTTGERKTTVSDVALLCANCHRLMHRLIANSGKWASVEDLRHAINPPDRV